MELDWSATGNPKTHVGGKKGAREPESPKTTQNTTCASFMLLIKAATFTSLLEQTYLIPTGSKFTPSKGEKLQLHHSFLHSS